MKNKAFYIDTDLLDEDIELIEFAVVVKASHLFSPEDSIKRKGGGYRTCAKIKYRDLQEAKTALWFARVDQEKAQSEGRRSHRTERRYYFCVGCHAWHLTSRLEKASPALVLAQTA